MAANDYSGAPALSFSGDRIAFSTPAGNLSPDDGGADDIFLRMTDTGETVLLRRASGVAGVAADGYSTDASISANGRRVAFSSHGDNLSGADDNAVLNIFVRDMQAHQTVLVSRADGAGGVGADAYLIRAAYLRGRGLRRLRVIRAHALSRCQRQAAGLCALIS